MGLVAFSADPGQLTKIQEQLAKQLIAKHLPPVCFIPLLKQLLQEPHLSADLQVGRSSEKTLQALSECLVDSQCTSQLALRSTMTT